MDKNKIDIIVIGAGPAGQSAAVRASQLGARVMVIESSKFGGTCLNWGCVPTKYLWESQHLQARIKRSASYGITAETKEFSFQSLMEKKDRAVELLSKGVRQLLQGYGIAVIEGTAVFSGLKTIRAAMKDGRTESFSADKIIIAAGSVPSAIPGYQFDHDKFIDSNDSLNLKNPPKTLLVVGGGAIGVELATIFSAFGSEVSLVEKESQLLPGEDAELARDVGRSLARQGIKIVTGIASFDGFIGQNEKILIAVGRRSNTAPLDLDKTGVKHGKGITTDEYLETSQKGIYSAGDAAGKAFLAYTAQAEGVCAAENALGARNTVDYAAIPRVVFSNPPAASVGATRTSGGELTGSFSFAANSRAFIEGERTGWVKVIAEKNSKIIKGAIVFGAHADEIIPVMAIAVKRKMTLGELSRDIFFHPSLSEAVHCACEDALGKCVDLPRPSFKHPAP